MKKNSGFTLIEIIIAMALAATLSAFVIVSMKNSFKFNAIGNGNINVNEQAFLVLNQLERDISSAYIFSYDLSLSETKDSVNASVGSKDAKSSDINIQLKIFEAATQDFDDLPEFRKNKQKLFKSLNFVSTSPLSVDKNKYNLVRVLYELKLDKLKKEEKRSYTLIRKETKTLENVKFKDDFEMEDRKGAKESIFNCVIAKNIKEFSLQFFKKEEELVKNQSSFNNKDKQIYKSFEWGEDEKTKGVIPFFVKYHIVFWGDEKNKEFAFDGFIKCFNEKMIFSKDNTVTSTATPKLSAAIATPATSARTLPPLSRNNSQTFFEGYKKPKKGERYVLVSIKGQPAMKILLDQFTKLMADRGVTNYVIPEGLIRREA